MNKKHLNRLAVIRASLLGLMFLAGVLVVPTLRAQEEDSVQEAADQTTETLRERIEKIVEQQKDNVEDALGEITDRRRGFTGQVTRVTEETLTVESRGATKIVPLNEAVLMEGDEEIDPDEVAVDDWVLVLGLIAEDESFSPRKITVLGGSPLPDPHVVHLGTLKDIKASSFDFQPRGQEEVLTVDTDSNTEYQDSEGNEADEDDFLADDQVLLVGYTDEEDTIATVVRALAPFTRDE